MNPSGKQPEKLPGFFISSIPKSGTHLLKQVVSGIPNVHHKVPNFILYEGRPEQYQEHLAKLKQVQPNEFALGHIYYSQKWAQMLENLGMNHIFITRDLRDVIVSLHYYILEKLPKHLLYEYFTSWKTTKKDRYLALIYGKKDVHYPDIREYFNRFKGWLADPRTLKVTYEDIMAQSTRRQSIARIANHLCKDFASPMPLQKVIDLMEENIKPAKSPTFRKGKIGNWREEFAPEVKAAFKEVAGDILIDLGYEKNLNW